MVARLTFLAKNWGAGLFPVHSTDRVGNSDQKAGVEKVSLHRPFPQHSHTRFFPSLEINLVMPARATIMNHDECSRCSYRAVNHIMSKKWQIYALLDAKYSDLKIIW